MSKIQVEKVDEFAQGKALDESITIETTADNQGDVFLQTNDHPSDPNVLIEEKDKICESLMKVSENPQVVPVVHATPSTLLNENNVDTCDDSMMAAILQSEFNREMDINKPKPFKPKPFKAEPAKAEPAKVEPAKAEPAKEEPLQDSCVQDISKVEYAKKVMNIKTFEQKKYVNNLMDLMNMGFCNFDQNLDLLTKNNNNLELVVEKIIGM